MQYLSFFFALNRQLKNLAIFVALVTTMLIVVCSLTMQASAQTTVWNNTDGGLYDAPENWATQQVPPADHAVAFIFAGEYGVDFRQDHTSSGIIMDFDTHVTFRIGDPVNDRNYRVMGDITIQDDASLTLENGTTGTEHFHLNADGGEVQVDGLDVNDHFGLTIGDNASLDSSFTLIGTQPGTYGRMLVQGANSELTATTVVVGLSGTGELNLEAGASLSTSLSAVMGNGPGSSAIVNIDGVGSDGQPTTWISNGTATTIGHQGTAELNITAGASVAFESTDIGEDSDAVVLVSGVGATGGPTTWSTGNMTIGFLGGGAELTFDEGALVLTDSAFVGGFGSGDVELNGTDTNGNPTQWIMTGHLSLGTETLGMINILDGANLATDTARIGGSTTGIGLGQLQLASNPGFPTSTWVNTGDVDLGGSQPGGSGLLEVRENSQVEIGGTLNIRHDSTVLVEDSVLIADQIENLNNGVFEMNNGGEVQFNRFDGDLVNPHGTLSPGVGSVASAIIGDYTQDGDASIVFEVGGYSGQHDQLTIQGTADFDGMLELRLVNGFVPDPGDTFVVLAANSLIAVFDNVTSGQRLTTVDGNGSFIVNFGPASSHNPNQIVLSDFASESGGIGDVNGDGEVNLLDVVPFVDVLVGGDFVAAADINQDGVVNLMDVAPFVDLLVG